MRNSPYKQKSNNSISPLAIGFIASFVLHSSLFAFFAINFSKSDTPKSMSSKALSISLNNISGDKSDSKKAQKKQKKPKKHKKIKEKPLPKDAPKSKPIEEIAQETPKEVVEEVKEISEVASNVDSTMAEATNASNEVEILGNDDALFKTIMDIINDNRDYPRMAIARKWKDKVEVEFVLLSSGEVKNIKVLNGKYALLNDNAIETIERTAKEYPKPNKDVKVKLIITYNMT